MTFWIPNLTYFASQIPQDAANDRHDSDHEHGHHQSQQCVLGGFQSFGVIHLDERHRAEHDCHHRGQDHGIQSVQQIGAPRPAHALSDQKPRGDQSKIHHPSVGICRVQHTRQSQKQIAEQEHRSPVPVLRSKAEEDKPIRLDRHEAFLRSSRDHNTSCDVESGETEKIYNDANDAECQERSVVTASTEDVRVLRQGRRPIGTGIALQRENAGHRNRNIESLEHLSHRVSDLGPNHHQALLHHPSLSRQLSSQGECSDPTQEESRQHDAANKSGGITKHTTGIQELRVEHEDVKCSPYGLHWFVPLHRQLSKDREMLRQCQKRTHGNAGCHHCTGFGS
mmetsp:Transcript_50719/g.115274  ORF Transcript_50719/g.115274 Transcript_50719/m.115274 type:complete len:338 (-) Transcript_50719:2347-3360(-)